MIGAANKVRGLAELVSDEDLVDVPPPGTEIPPPSAHSCGGAE